MRLAQTPPVRNGDESAEAQGGSRTRNAFLGCVLFTTLCACKGVLPQPADQWRPRPDLSASYQWTARDSTFLSGPGPMRWSASPRSVWRDERGFIHLSMRREGLHWLGAEVSTPLPTAYVRVEAELEVDVARLDTSTVIGLFLYRDDDSEIDFELSAWGEPTADRGQFVVAPPTQPGRMHRFAIPDGAWRMHFLLEWRRDSIRFVASDAHGWREEWTYTGRDRPRPRGHRLHINVWRQAETRPWHERGADAAVRILNVSELKD